jgi:hypothetical protein
MVYILKRTGSRKWTVHETPPKHGMVSLTVLDCTIAAERYVLGPDLLDDMEENEKLKQFKLLTQVENGLQIFRSNHRNVSEIRGLEMPHEKKTVRDGDLVLRRRETQQFQKQHPFSSNG